MYSFLDWVFLVYFGTHVPISMFIDFQAVLPSEWYFGWPKDLVQWYLKMYGDPFMNPNTSPMWFKLFVSCELVIQFPFFFALFYGVLCKKQATQWFRLSSIVYSAHVITTLIPILAYFVYGQSKDFIDGEIPKNRLMLTLFYSPYFLVPLSLLLKSLFFFPKYENLQKKHV